MKVDGSLKSLLQGVSQQPFRTRLPGQCSVQDNMSANPVDGLTRRPPLKWVSDLFTTEDSVQFYDLRVGANKYLAAAHNGSIRVFELDGTEKTVTEHDSGFDYIGNAPLVFTTLENVTYVANTQTECGMEAELPTFLAHGSIVYIRGGNYGTTYTITVNWKDAGPGGTARTISASTTTSDTAIATIQTKAIATALKTALDAVTANSFNTTFDVTRVEDVLYIQWKPATGRTDIFSVVASDTAGNQNCIACNNDVKMISQLPRFAPHGYYVRVSGDGSAGEDDYYLEFSVTPDDQGGVPAVGEGFGKDGIWLETVKNGIEYLVDRTTMPHVLTYNEALDEFSFGPGEWADRVVGDTESNPTPSFIGRTINDLSYFQGRLVILSGPNVIMSRTNDPLDFWAETAVRITDTDPIDLQSTALGVSEMLRAVPNNRDLTVFADNAQFVILGRNQITPTNCSLVLTTAFEANMAAKPVAAGRNTFFAINYGNFTGIREFFIADTADINDARPITSHVLKYIVGRASRLASSSNFDMLLVKAGDPNILYTYEYIWSGQEKVQSAWSRWIFPQEVSYFFFVESVIYVVCVVDGEYGLFSMDLDTLADDGLSYQVKLDNRVTLTGVADTAVSPIPYAEDDTDILFVQGEGCANPGMLAEVLEYDSDTNTYTFKNNHGGGTLYAGRRYTSTYRPTMPVVRDRDGVQDGNGRLVISKFIVTTQDSGSFVARLLSPHRSTRTLTITGRAVGSPLSVVGQEAIVSGSHIIPFRDNTDLGELELTCNEHTPFTVLDIEWMGQYTKRGTRISNGG